MALIIACMLRGLGAPITSIGGAGMRKAFDQTAANWIGYRWEDNRNHGCRTLCHLRLRITVGHNHIDGQPDELGRVIAV